MFAIIRLLLNPYYINIGMLFLWTVILLNNKKINGTKTFVFISTLNWVLLSGLRHISIGADTIAYYHSYKRTILTTWGTLFRNFLEIIFLGSDGKDPGYYIFVKISQLITDNYQVFLIIIAIIFTVPLGFWIYRNSNNPLISFFIYSTLFYSFFSITGIRQTIATAMVVLIGYEFIKERRFWPFLLLTLLAFTIHKSSLSFLPFYFIANKKITKKYLLIISSFIPVIFVFRNKLMFVLGTLTGYEQFINQYEGAGTWTFTTLLIILTGLTMWKYKIIIRNNVQATHYINALFIALVFVPLTFVDPSAMRVVQYYSIFLILLVPEIIRSFNPKERTIVYYVATSLLIVLFAKNNPQYLFFWQ